MSDPFEHPDERVCRAVHSLMDYKMISRLTQNVKTAGT